MSSQLQVRKQVPILLAHAPSAALTNALLNELAMVLQMGHDAGSQSSFPLAFQLFEALTSGRSSTVRWT